MEIHSCTHNTKALSKPLGSKFFVKLCYRQIDLRTVLHDKILLKFLEVSSLQSYST